MYILGVHNGLTAGATLMKDGKIITAVNEERFNRKKMYWGFPFESIKYVSAEAGSRARHCSHIADLNLLSSHNRHCQRQQEDEYHSCHSFAHHWIPPSHFLVVP